MCSITPFIVYMRLSLNHQTTLRLDLTWCHFPCSLQHTKHFCLKRISYHQVLESLSLNENSPESSQVDPSTCEVALSSQSPLSDPYGLFKNEETDNYLEYYDTHVRVPHFCRTSREILSLASEKQVVLDSRKEKREDYLKTLELLGKRGADPNMSRIPMPVLFLAILACDSEGIKRLLLLGARTDIPLPPEARLPFLTFI